MSTKILWVIVICAVIALGLIIYFIYFSKTPSETTGLPAGGGPSSSSSTFPGWKKVVVPPPDYSSLQKTDEVGVQDDRGNEEEETLPPIPEGEKLRAVSYRGIISKIEESSLEFKPVNSDDSDLVVTASVDSNTKITQIILPQTTAKENLKLEDLNTGDEIVISGLAKDYAQPIVSTASIERFYLK